MPTTQSGIEYWQSFDLGGQKAYTEQFQRDGNNFTAVLMCKWEDVQEFRRDVLGYTEYDASTPRKFSRSLPMLCPYTQRAYAVSMNLLNYGRKPDNADVGDFDEDVIAYTGITDGNDVPAFYPDPTFDGWFTTHVAVYQVTFSRLLYTLRSDYDLDEYYDFTDEMGMEIDRNVIRQRVNNVQELRIPGWNYKEEGTSPSVPIFVNGFRPAVESEIVYTWIQVPYDKVPITAIKNCRLKVNASTFDDTKPAETMLFIDAKGFDGPPTEGADGNLYYDIQYVFREKINISAGNPVGHNHFLNAAGQWKKAERDDAAGVFVYETTSDFPKLFSPEGAT